MSIEETDRKYYTVSNNRLELREYIAADGGSQAGLIFDAPTPLGLIQRIEREGFDYYGARKFNGEWYGIYTATSGVGVRSEGEVVLK